MDDIEEKAKEWVRRNKRSIIEKFASLKEYTPVENPFTLFMAGSPGAGKTEFSKTFIENYPGHVKIVRIDADEIRKMIPNYEEGKAYKVQGAASLGVEKVFDYVQSHSQNCILDGTFADINIVTKDVSRALNKDRKVGIMYIYQDPKVAWNFTKIREKVEGRKVSKEIFIKCFLDARENVLRIKKLYPQIELNIAIKDFENKLEKSHFNVDLLDPYIKMQYTAEELEELLI